MKRWTWMLICLVVAATWLVVPVEADDDTEPSALDILPYRYAWVRAIDAPVFDQAGDPVEMTPVDYISSRDVWVSLKREVWAGEYLWYQIDQNKYMLARDLWLGPPSNLRGPVMDEETPYQPFGFVLESGLPVKSRPGAGRDEPTLETLSRYTQVPLLGRVETEDGTWYQIGPQRYISGGLVRVVTAIERPEGVGPRDKWISVNIAEQTLAAYEGDRMVFAALVSTGRPWWPTPQGLFSIWIKIRMHDMVGGDYGLEDVPWAMYFYGSYALHTSYWHDGFGYVRSHGCVNLSPLDAKWLYEWALPAMPAGYNAVRSGAESPGTWVYIYDTPAGPGLAEVE